MGKINPVMEAKRALRLKASQSTLTYRDRTNADKDAAQVRATERELDGLKGNILDAAFIDSTRHTVFASTHSYLIFVDVSKGLMQENDTISVVAHAKTNNPIHGLYYSKVLDVLLAYPGEGSDHDIEIYDPRTRQQRFVLHKHESKILAVCEVILDKAHPQKDHFFVTSSINKKLLMWPSAPISALMKKSDAKKMLRIADTMDYELRGHNHAIHSLVYAPVREMLFGCGFDFDIIGWDPFSRDLCMRFVGHFKSMVGLQVVYIPSEKLLSVDEMGVMKLWNISKELGIYGEQESSVVLQCAQPPHIKDFTKTIDGGKTVAILAEKVYFLSIEGDILDDLKPLYSGIGISSISGRLFTIYRSTIQIFDVITAMKVKRVAFLDPDRVSTTDQIISKNDEMKMGSLIPNTHSFDQQQMPAISGSHSPRAPIEVNLKAIGGIDIKDRVTAVAIDCKGKKVFLGTHDGRVLLFDSYTFGLLKQLTCETEDNAFHEQGSVLAMSYVDRDELVVAVYANGAVKVFGGCQHGGYMAQKSSNLHVDPRLHNDYDGMSTSHIHGDKSYPRARGGRAPSRPYLLRECDLGVIVDLSVRAMTVSVAHSLIAVLTKSGLVYLYDYLTLEFIQAIAIEDETAPRGTTVQYVAIQFLPYVPIFLVVNSLQRVIAWTVKSMGYRHLLSWHIYADCTYNQGAHEFYRGYNVETLDLNGKVDASLRMQDDNDENSSKRNDDEECEEGKDKFEGKKDKTKEKDGQENGSDKNKNNDEEESAKANNPFIRFYPNMKATITSFRCYAFPSPLDDEDYKALKPGKINPYYRYILLFGNEVGQFYTQNVTEMISYSTAFEYVPKLDAQLAVYQKLKPKRYEGIAEYDYDTTYTRSRMPDDWASKVANPLRKDTANNLMESTTTASFSASTNSGKISNSNGGFIPSQAFKLTRAQTRRNLRVGKKKVKLDQPLEIYVQGLYAWVAYSQISIVGIDFYNPSINFCSDTFTPLDGLYEQFPHHNKLPFIVTMSEYGTVRIWTLGGVYLGQTFDDGADEESIDKFMNENDTGSGKGDGDFLKQVEGVIVDTNNIEDKKSKGSMFDEQAMIASTTFITSLISDTPSKGPNREEEETISSKVFVRSETRPVIMTRRLSVVPKSISFVKKDSAHNLEIARVGSGNAGSGNSVSTIKSVLEFAEVTKKVFGSKGWLLPLATVTLPTLKKGSDVFAVQPITRFSAVQFSYIHMIWNWLVPQVRKEIDLFFRNKLELEEEKEHIDGDIAKRKLSNLPKGASYKQRFQSSENLLKGLDSFFLDKQEGEKKVHHGKQEDGEHEKSPNKKRINKTLDEMLQDIDREHDPERFFEKIVGAMSERELELVSALQDQCQDKFDKRNLNHLIDYIQDSEFFSSSSKQGVSQALTFKNYEKEKLRNRRMIRSISQEVQDMIESIVSSEQSNHHRSSTMGEISNKDDVLATTSVARILVEGEVTGIVQIPPLDVKPVILQDAMNADPDCIQLKFPFGEKKKNQKLAASSSSSVDQIQHGPGLQLPTVMRVPSYGVSDEDLQDLKKVTDLSAIVEMDSNSNIQARPKTANSAIRSSADITRGMGSSNITSSQPNLSTLRPKSAQFSRSDGFQWANTTAPSHEHDTKLRHSSSELRINKIIDKLESINVNESSLDFTPLRSMNELILSRPSTAPAIISSNKEMDLFCDGDNHPISLLGRTSMMEDTFSNFDRLTEISGRVQQAITVDKQGEQKNFRLYDPLYKKKMMIMLRNRRKMKQKLSFAKDKDKYIDEDDYHQHFEDVVDMEREMKKQHNKEMLKQAQAMGNKDSFYGPYKLAELVKFLHFLELLTPIDLSHQERNQITYFDDTGIIDLTKFMRDQHYYMVNDIIDIVTRLMGTKHPLLEQLIFFRDESPGLERITVYQLIGLVFRLSKSLGIQLRIFLFVTAAHLIYDLMRTASPPKEFKTGNAANNASKKLPPAGPIPRTTSSSSVITNKSKDEGNMKEKDPSPALVKHYSSLLVEKPPEAQVDERRKSIRFVEASVLSSSLSLDQSTTDPSQPSFTISSPSPALKSGGSRFKNNLQSTIEVDKLINHDSNVENNNDGDGGPLDVNQSLDSTFLGQRTPLLDPPEPPGGTLNLQAIAEESRVESIETEGLQNLKETLTGIVSKFIVKPHPTRGFYNWVVKRKVALLIYHISWFSFKMLASI